MKHRTAILSLLTAALALPATAATFDFDDPKKVNNIVFLLDAPLESINGTADGITGTVDYDPEHPEKIAGEIVLDTKTLTVPNDTMQEHLHGERWMKTDEHGKIVFKIHGLSDMEKNGDTVEGTLHGTMTLMGQEKEMTVPVKVTHLPGALGKRMNGQMEGDLLVARSNFVIERSTFGIGGSSTEKVSDEIEIRLSLAGYHPTGG